jgi:hypothetical protein
LPTAAEVGGIALVIGGVLLHHLAASDVGSLRRACRATPPARRGALHLSGTGRSCPSCVCRRRPS